MPAGSDPGGGRDAGKVAGLVLAAGASRRMGRPKQLLPLGEHTLLQRVLKEALSSELDSVILVLGHESAAIRRSLGVLEDHPRLQIVENPDYLQGIGASIRCGLRSAEAGHEHVMILLADMPRVSAHLINRLLRRHVRSGAPLGAVLSAGRRTHPVMFSRELYPELHRLTGDRGGRELFERHADRTCLVEPDVPYDDRDVDTAEEYDNLLNRETR